MISSRALLSYLEADLQSVSCEPDLGQTPEILQSLKDRMMASLTKKLLQNRTPECAKTAIESFKACNDVCETVAIDTKDPVFSHHRGIIQRSLPEISWSDIFELGETGPGASVFSQGRNSAYEKLFCNQITTTSLGLYIEYVQYLKKYPTLFKAEQLRTGLWVGADPVAIVEGSSLSTVPKNDETDRVICTEPSLNLYAQKGVGALLNRVLASRWGYSKSKQPGRNAKLSRVGSRSGTFATIDLKNASDLISLRLVKELFPSDWVAALEDCRSPMTKIDGKYVTLHMISSMGNGFTFNLMTFILTTAIEAILEQRQWASFLYDDMSCRTAPFGVFGDDIVVPTDIYEPLCAYLAKIGLVVNLDKSFNQGSFRESCGADWFDGYNVRGVYIKGLKSDQQKLTAINRLHAWSAQHHIRLPSLIKAIYADLEKTPPFVPFDEADDAGLKVPAILMASCRYVAYKAKSKKFRIAFHKEDRVVLRRSHENIIGYVVAAASGWLRGGRVDRKNENPVYIREKLFTTRWNYIPERPYCRNVTVRDWWKVLVVP